MTALRDRVRALTAAPGARERLAAAGVAVVAAVATYLLATTVFAYHSGNHDEAVYLQQAAMLSAGQLELYAGDLVGAFRPWFFVADGGRLYPKYQPYPAALYAVPMALVGEPRLALAAVAAANALLVYVLGAMAFDRRVGVVAAACFAASPLALVTTSVFLPYAPTTTLNLLFAVLYLRGERRGEVASAAGAGLAIGLAFFARPFTAVLFAAPFVAHALLDVARAVRDGGVRPVPTSVRRNAATAGLGLAFVALALAYNARLTGSPLVFPYEAFAPLDGPGFGHREILGHAVDYTPELALVVNGYALRYLATRWFTAGALGTLVAAAGLALVAHRFRLERTSSGAPPFEADPAAVGTLAGLLVSVPLGNFAFWGTNNVLGTMSDPTDGLVAQFGPFYHFDLLVPLSVFAAVGVVAGWRALRERLEAHERPATRPVLAVVLAVGLVVAAVASAAVVAGPLERNAGHGERYEHAYAPFEETDLEDALVLLPTPYGPWLNHPFQYLRNDPGFDGRVVYAMQRDAAGDFAVLDAYPDREQYRYGYRGRWGPSTDARVAPTLQPVEVRSGAALDAETTVGVPDRVERARVRLAAGDAHASYGVSDPGGRLSIAWALDGGAARLPGSDDPAVVLEGADTVVLTVTLVEPGGATFTYRQEATVRAGDGRVEAVWPPARFVCPLVTDCGREGTYLPDRPDEHREWVTFETSLTERSASVGQVAV